MVLLIDCDPRRTPVDGTVAGRPPCVVVTLPSIRRSVAINFADTLQPVDVARGRLQVAPRSVVIETF